MTIEIKSFAGATLFSSDNNARDVRAALEQALKGGADLHGANLRDAKNSELACALTQIVPAGAIIGWKQCRDNRIVKMLIPEQAARSNGAGRKCRAEYVDVLEIIDKDGNRVGSAVSQHDPAFLYTVGAIVHPSEPFDPDLWNECSSGIHFYITRVEAEAQ